MNKATIMAALLTLCCTAANAQESEMKPIGKNNITLKSDLMTPEALWAMGRIASHQASPDGKKIVYQVGYYSVKQNKSHHVLHVIDADGKNNKLLTTTAKNETDAAWINNGQRIAFLSDGQIWTMNADGTDRKQMTKDKDGIDGFKFSPDGKHVILIKQLPYHESIKERPADLPKSTGRLITDLNYRHWDEYVEAIPHPFVADVTADGINEGKDIMQGEPYECPVKPFGGIEQLDWSKDSKQIAYTSRKKTGVEYAVSTDTDIYLYNIETGKTTNLCKSEGYVEPKIDPTKTMKTQAVNAPDNLKNNPGYDQNPQFSPDGKYIAWQSMARNGYESDRNRLCILNLSTAEKTYVTEKFDSNVDAFCWGADSKTLYFLGVWHGCEMIYQTNLNGEVTQLTDGWFDYGSIYLLNDGKKLLAERHSMSQGAELYVVNPSKKEKKSEVEQITFENKHLYDQMTFGKIQQRWTKTTDGKDMLYWIVLPSHFDETKKYPTLLFCEGGPQSPVSQFWSYRWNMQIMAANGYVVIAPNRHGLPGFGSE